MPGAPKQFGPPMRAPMKMPPATRATAVNKTDSNAKRKRISTPVKNENRNVKVENAVPSIPRPFQPIQHIQLADGDMWGATILLPNGGQDCHLGYFKSEMAALQCYHRAMKAISECALDEFLEFLRKQRKLGVDVTNIAPPRKKRRYRRQVESKHERWKKERLAGNKRLAQKIKDKRLEVMSKRKTIADSPPLKLESPPIKLEHPKHAAPSIPKDRREARYDTFVKVEPASSWPAPNCPIPSLERGSGTTDDPPEVLDRVNNLLREVRNQGGNVKIYDQSG